MGKFQKGNAGKPKGATSERSKQWEDLAEAIIERHAGRFNQILGNMMDSGDPKMEETGCYIFLQALEYFKPKQSRVQHAGDASAPITFVLPTNDKGEQMI